MKKALLLLVLLLTLTRPAPGQTHTQSLTFNDLGLGGGAADSGTYNQNDTFSFDVYLTFAGYNCLGLTFLLETQTLNNFASSLFITGLTYGTAFPDPTHPVSNPVPFDSALVASPGFRVAEGDLGSTVNLPYAKTQVPPGTYLVAHVSFAITGAQPGTYTLQSTTLFGRQSVTASFDGTNIMEEFIPEEEYTITIVPEPSALALLVVGTIGVAATFCRRAVSKELRS